MHWRDTNVYFVIGLDLLGDRVVADVRLFGAAAARCGVGLIHAIHDKSEVRVTHDWVLTYRVPGSQLVVRVVLVGETVHLLVIFLSDNVQGFEVIYHNNMFT